MVQDAFVKLAGRLFALRTSDASGAYLRRVMVNTVLSRSRSRRREQARQDRSARLSAGGDAWADQEPPDGPLWDALTTVTTRLAPTPAGPVRAPIVNGVPQVKVTQGRGPAGTRVRVEGSGFTDEQWLGRGKMLWLAASGGCGVSAQAEHDIEVTADGRLTGSFTVPARGACPLSAARVDPLGVDAQLAVVEQGLAEVGLALLERRPRSRNPAKAASASATRSTTGQTSVLKSEKSTSTKPSWERR